MRFNRTDLVYRLTAWPTFCALVGVVRRLMLLFEFLFMDERRIILNGCKLSN